jgi:addiction module HigA family antidote
MNYKTSIQSFNPDYSVIPGDSLLEIMESKGLTQADLAERTGRPKKTINEIAKGKAAITFETAIQLERVLGVPASFWISLESNYRSNLARIEEREKLSLQTAWLSKFPVAEMIKRKWIQNRTDKVEMLEEVLSFFGVASPNAWEEMWHHRDGIADFRRQTAEVDNTGIVATWLRKGELIGRELDCKKFDASAFKQALHYIRLRTSHPDINETCRQMQEICANAGVAVVLVREFPRLGVYGATRWLSQDKALIQLSLHYKRADQFWFSFFHEAGHILLHGKRDMFVEKKGHIDKNEEEANNFAKNHLIPQKEYNDFVELGNFSTDSIVSFANQLSIHPCIVVGRLQHEKRVGFNERNDLVLKLAWAD